MPLPRSILAGIEPCDRDLRVVSGRWPDDLDGEISISAPHPRYFDGPHAFFGDGIHYRLSLRPGRHGAPEGGFAWRWHWIDSPSARLRRKRPDVFQPTLLGTFSPFGFSNAANTAPLPWGDRLFHTWDAGRPVEVDPVSMRFLGEVGHRSEWREFLPQPLLPMVTSTAHPVIDLERDCLWSVNTAFGQLELVGWDGAGPIRRWPVAGAVVPQSLHTITATRDWIVVADCAFKVEPRMLSGGERKEPNNPSEPVYLIRKEDALATPPGAEIACRSFTLAPEVMHYYAVLDDSDGVQVVFEHTECTDLAIPQRDGDVDATGRPCDPAFRGLYAFGLTPSRMSLVVFDPETGRQRERAHFVDPERLWAQQLSAIDWSPGGLARPTARHMLYHGWRPEAVTQRVLALYRDRVDPATLPPEEIPARLVTLSMPELAPGAEHVWPLDELPTSPVFVPRRAGEAGDGPARSAGDGPARRAGDAPASEPGGHDGYLVVPVYSDAGFRVELFDAANVAAGPVAALAARGHVVPFVVHAAWLPRAVPAPELPRVRFSDELEGLDSLPDDLARTAREVAREIDEGVPLVS